MINLIPLSFLSKMGMYDIEIHGANVKVSIVDNLALVDAKINELKSSLQTPQRRVVGLDIKFAPVDIDEDDGIFSPVSKTLLLCVGTDCLMTQLPASMEVTDTLRQFLSDETFCFLGSEMREKVAVLGRLHFNEYAQCVDCKTGVEVGYLAVKILKKGNVDKYGLSELAGEVGMDIKEPIGACPNWNAVAFSDEEVKQHKFELSIIFNMINLIPLSFLSKMGMYDIEIHGANVKVCIVDNRALVDAKIDELKSSLQISQRRVVGLDIKFVPVIVNEDDENTIFSTEDFIPVGKILLLCVGTDCLMIQLSDSLEVTDTLRQFLSDETICFLGTEMREKVAELGRLFFNERVGCKTGVEVGYLAAKILKKGNVDKYGLSELAGEVGMDIKEPIGARPKWNAVAFSDKEVKYAVHNAYTSYVIGNKLLDML
ncbi:hypothetical protein SO802_013818 [Lithocarpus litseifolius]|uniref:3'-5' exonuclease domain-containing protein n=1 Tax=Lithocarpus litseifolius TaxID=425828 RepID=A0AAW2D8T2_9ROSI